MQRKVQVKTMKRKLSLMISAVFMIPVAVFISVLSVKSAKNSGGTHIMLGGRAELRNTIELSASEIDNLEIIYTSKNIVVYPSEDDRIIIKEYLISDRPEAQAKVDATDDTVTKDKERTVRVTGGKAFTITIFGFWGMGERIEVYLPREGLKNLLMQTSSGNIKAESDFSMKAERFEAVAGSGNIVWRDTDAGEVRIEAGSGNLMAENLTGDMEIGTGSGNIRLVNPEGSAEITAGSGNITVEEFSAQGFVKTGSGNIRMEVQEIAGDLKLRTGSGNCRLVLPQQSSFRFAAQTGSGNINTFFDDMLTYNKKGNQAQGEIGEDPSALISVEANSGNVNITAE